MYSFIFAMALTYATMLTVREQSCHSGAAFCFLHMRFMPAVFLHAGLASQKFR